jgi:hypothetical protein
LRYECIAHSHLRRFGEPTFRLRNRTNLATKADFSDEDCVAWKRAIVHARCKRRRNG